MQVWNQRSGGWEPRLCCLWQPSVEPGLGFTWQGKEQALSPQTDNRQLTLEQAVQRLRQVGILVRQRDQQQ